MPEMTVQNATYALAKTSPVSAFSKFYSRRQVREGRLAA